MWELRDKSESQVTSIFRTDNDGVIGSPLMSIGGDNYSLIGY